MFSLNPNPGIFQVFTSTIGGLFEITVPGQSPCQAARIGVLGRALPESGAFFSKLFAKREE
jgi:hypothetical protein